MTSLEVRFYGKVMSEKEMRNNQKSPWPWIIGMIILAGFIWFMLVYVYIPENNDNKVLPGDISSEGNGYKTPIDSINEIREFISYADNTGSITSSTDYSEKGMIKLQSAISYLADRVDSTDVLVAEDLDSLDYSVVRIDTSSYDYLGELRPAILNAVDAIEAIQKINYPRLADYITSLKQIAEGINIKRSPRSQLQKIRNFYKKAAELLMQMRLSYAYSLNRNSY